MGRIGVASHPARKRADFPRVSADGNRQPTGSGGKADMTRAVTPVVRPPPIFGSRLCRSTVQVDPKANGATASRPRRCSMLEPDALKGARPVLRGGGGGDPTSLPDYGKSVMTDAAATIAEALGRLHRSGWSTGCTAFHDGAGGLSWLVSGTNGENLIRAWGP